MRIAIDCRKFDDFGIGSYIRGLVGGCTRIGGDDEFILLAPARAASFLPATGRFELIEENSPKYSLRELASLSRRIKALKPDLFHAPHYVVPKLSIPTVVTIHDLIHLRLPGVMNSHKRAYARWMIGRAARADGVIAVSKAAGSDIVHNFPSAASKLRVIPNGVDDSFFISDSVNPRGGRYFLYVGNDKPHKNLDGLIAAFKRFRDDQGSAELHLVGASAERFANLPGVKQLGRVSNEELISLYRGAIALVMPSFEEGFGLPVAEAMATETAVICSNIAALSEVAQGGAILVDPHRPEEMAAAMRLLGSDDSARKSLAAAGRQAAEAYRWDRAARETLAVYREVAQRSDGFQPS